MMTKSLSIFFFGSSHFSSIVLEEFLKNWQGQPLYITVVTVPDKKGGRGLKLTSPEIKKTAQKYKFEVIQPETLDEKLAHRIKKEGQLIIVAGYGKILPLSVIKAPSLGALNVHPSLLPKFRGPSPIQSAILAGEKKTGISLATITEKVDAGDILVQAKINIERKDTALSLETKLAQLGGKVLAKSLPLFIEGKITPLPQDERKATYTQKIKKEDGQMNFEKPAFYLERMIRAFYPWPSAYTFFKGKILKILEAEVIDKDLFEKAGEFGIYNQSLAIQTGKGMLVCKKVQIEGKKPISGEDFVKGYLKK